MQKIIFVSFLFCMQILFAQADTDTLEDFEKEYATQEINDSLIGYNRFMHNINWDIYDYILNPFLQTYNQVVPLGYRYGIYNFFDNLTSPLRFLAHFFALEFKSAMDEFGRFALNSSAGILGIFDVASQNHLYSQRIDFGITFGKWGVGSGSYLVLPLLGPSSIRDTIAMPLNALANPATYLDSTSWSVSAYALRAANSFARHKDILDTLREDAIGDDYFLIRDAYAQRRKELIIGD